MDGTHNAASPCMLNTRMAVYNWVEIKTQARQLTGERIGYWFCLFLRRGKGRLNIGMRQGREPGRKGFVGIKELFSVCYNPEILYTLLLTSHGEYSHLVFESGYLTCNDWDPNFKCYFLC